MRYLEKHIMCLYYWVMWVIFLPKVISTSNAKKQTSSGHQQLSQVVSDGCLICRNVISNHMMWVDSSDDVLFGYRMVFRPNINMWIRAKMGRLKVQDCRQIIRDKWLYRITQGYKWNSSPQIRRCYQLHLCSTRHSFVWLLNSTCIHIKESDMKSESTINVQFTISKWYILNKHCRARPCEWPRPYDPDFSLSMSHLFGICFVAYT